MDQINNKPESPLPWKIEPRYGRPDDKSNQQPWEVMTDEFGTLTGEYSNYKDSAYIIHACNAYPKLIKAIKEFTQDSYFAEEKDNFYPQEIRDLLKDLGEWNP